jgi:membrane-bound metal-dependent hydrolase YbcI (DUF457 family)
LLSRRAEPTAAAVLVGAVVSIDLLWSLLEGSTGALAYGLVDEPAHLATCAIVLLCAVALSGRRPAAAFLAGALAASVLIDLDHLPGYLGSQALEGTLPRPYTHSAATVLVLAALGLAARRRDLRALGLGVALGVSAHLLRDLATGPGVSLLWPVSEVPIRMPYAVYAGALVTMILAVNARGVGALSARRAMRLALTAGLAALAIAVLSLAPSPAGAHTVSIGAFIPGAERNPALIDQWSAGTGRQPLILVTYRGWDSPLIDSRALDGFDSRGAVPMITWEPWDQDEAPVTWESTEIPVPLWSIAAGDQDTYIRRSAREAAAWGKPLFVRFAHEMNGSWYPWGWGVGDGSPASFKAAWKHVVSIFREEGAANVRWVWCPYVSNTRPRQFRRFYPGDEWVDWASFDGFNWGSYRAWQSFEKIFGATYGQITKVTRRPIMIGEMGVNEAGGNKARWVSSALRKYLPRYRHVRAAVWWSDADERADFRVDSSPAALAAFRSALAATAYASSPQQLLSTPSLLGPPRKAQRRRSAHHDRRR